jgi:hypothetical protein
MVNSNMMRLAGNVAHKAVASVGGCSDDVRQNRPRRGWEDLRIAYKVLVGKNKGKRQPGKPRRKWDDNI